MNTATITSHNQIIPATRRSTHSLPRKKQVRDGEIAKKLIHAWDTKGDKELLLNVFIKEKDLLSDERYWELLRSTWIICGNIKNIPTFRKMFESKRPKRNWFSTPEEIARLNSLPEIFTVYRAQNGEEINGISFTLSLAVAQTYKFKFDKDRIITKEIKRSDVFAFIERNGEEEVLIL